MVAMRREMGNEVKLNIKEGSQCLKGKCPKNSHHQELRDRIPCSAY